MAVGTVGGCAHDLQQAENLARTMVTTGGMLPITGKGPQVALQARGPQAANDVDAAAQRFVTAAYAHSMALLKRHRPLLVALSQRLVAEKTVPGAVVRRATRQRLKQIQLDDV